MTRDLPPTSTRWLASAQRLAAQQQPFALVTVLRVQAPASARPGDKALVTADGHIDGWIGGGCAQPAVLRTVRRALHDGVPRMIRITPAESGLERELDDVLEFGMACHSGGTLELLVDPMLPPAHLVVIGDSPVAASLAEIAPSVGFSVTVVAHEHPEPGAHVIASDAAETVAAQLPPGAFVVVATQGRRDLQGLRAALALRARKVFFVASARKAQVLRAALVESGCEAAAVDAIVAPAGQAIGAQTPPEIALAVLAATVAARREVPAPTPAMAATPATREPAAPLPDPPIVAASSCCGGATRARQP